MNTKRCMTDRTYAILCKKLGDKARIEKAYAWFGSLDISVVREIKTPVAYILANTAQWDK